MAGEATHPDLINGSLVGILSELEQDKTFLKLAAGDIEASDDVDNSVLAGIPEGLRPALAAAIGQGVAGKPGKPVVLVVASGREAEETVGSLRSWYDGDPNDIAQLEAWETLPHERLSPRADTVASRMAVFRRLKHPSDTDSMFGPIRILVMPIRSLIQPVVQGLGDVEPLVFTVGEDLPLDEAAKRLIENAYTRVDLVMDRGEFAVRGGILDVFPPTAPHPVRIEFFGDEIDTIKEFHASDQRTYGDGLKTIWATACRELQLTDAVRTRAKALVGSIPNAEDMLESIANAIPVEGMESLMPALVDHLEPVGSMLPKHAVILLSDPEKLRRSAEDLAKTANEFLAASWHVAASGHGAGAPISFDEASFLDYAETISSLEYSEHPVIRLTSFGVDTTLTGHVQLDAQNPAEFRGDEAKASQGIEGLLDAGFHVTITAAAAGTLARLKRAINTTGIANFDVIRSQAIDGFVDKAAKIALLTERDLTGRTSAVAVAKTPKRRRKAIDLVELKKGDYVVHEQHGIGRFIEMRQRIIGTGANKTTREYLVIEYAPSKRGAPADKLFIPTDQLDQVSKYIGAEAPKLNKLGGSDWAATKAKARKHVHEIADDLIKLYSARQRAKGFAFSPDTPWQKELEDAFPYQETADQLTTIDEVKSDMEKPVPMDRLICGDVGFGKTEIALRAAFKAVQDGKQVAVLVPTTLLVQQHYQTFAERYSGFPVTVAQLSRFQTEKEVATTLEEMAQGKVDVVIGTHRLLSSKVHYKDLGLVIIDEEQRFGVEHKEALKKLRVNVDVLSMSATPIPRTLEMAVTGIREMSTITTPPEERHPVLTFAGPYDEGQVVAAIRREMAREGQVFLVHNRVASIDRVAARIREMVPEARVVTAHGQMSEKTLEKVMVDFWERRADVLVCTTIVEAGLDIPTANTLIVDRADHMGLSQMHQLRGRVGRSRERGYAYFLYPGDRTLTTTAHDRLAALAANNELGAGMAIAMKDLEIRGAGNLLGDEQSGHIADVGFDLYLRLVGEAVAEFKGDGPGEEEKPMRIELPVNAHLPEDYVESERLRLEMYKRIAEVTSTDDIEALRGELQDRYGPVPEQAESLLTVAAFRLLCRQAGLTEVMSQGRSIRFAPIAGRRAPDGTELSLPDSRRVRLDRLYPGTLVKNAANLALVPAPRTAKVGGQPIIGDELIAWASGFVRDILLPDAPRRQGTAGNTAGDTVGATAGAAAG